MSTTRDLVAALKTELRAAGITYAELGRQLQMAESSIKRMFSKEEMSLARVDAVLRVLKMDFAELARQVADAQPLRAELTLQQEAAVVADSKLLLLAICCISQWSFEQIVGTYALTDAECVALLLKLDKLGVIELRPLNRYRLKVAKGFRWQPDGPVMAYFRERVVGDYFGGGFDGVGETLMLVHGEISSAQAASFVERLQRLGQDFSQQHAAEQRLADEYKRPYTLVVGMRSWLFAPFRDLKRQAAPPAVTCSAGTARPPRRVRS